MELLTHIREICAARGTTIAKVEKAIGFNKVIYNWDKYTPSIDKVVAVADFFGLSVDELIGREVKDQISLEDRRILAMFNELNQEGRLAAFKQLEFIAAQPEYIKSGQSGEMEA